MGVIPVPEMRYSWLGLGYAFLCALGILFAEKWFDIVLAVAGTWLGYWLAKHQLDLGQARNFDVPGVCPAANRRVG
jgi:hypothetical protein